MSEMASSTPHASSHPDPSRSEEVEAQIPDTEDTNATISETALPYLATARDQDDLERSIGRQADQLLTEQADARDQKRLEKTEARKSRYVAQLERLQQRLTQPGSSRVKNPIRDEIAEIEVAAAQLDEELEQIRKRVADRHQDAEDMGEHDDGQMGGSVADADGRLPNEGRRDFLIRTGKITPFSKMPGTLRTSSNLADIMLDAEGEEEYEGSADEGHGDGGGAKQVPKSHRELLMPGGFDDETSETSETSQVEKSPQSNGARKRRRIESKISNVARNSPSPSASPPPRDLSSDDDSDAFDPGMNDRELATLGDSDDEDRLIRDGAASDDEEIPMDTEPHRKIKGRLKKRKAAVKSRDEEDDLGGVDDGDEGVYLTRLKAWVRKRSAARRRAAERAQQVEPNLADPETEDVEPEELPEWFMPHPTRPDAKVDGGLRIPGDIYPSLFDYQKTGVQWLGELFNQQVGGIIGDEMGLGKTIQIISFLAGLHYSRKLSKPIIVVTPATVMKQWVNEFHRWWPPLRVSILHSSGSGMLDVGRERDIEDDLEVQAWQDRKVSSRGQQAAKRILRRVVKDGHVLVTTYSGLQSYANLLIPQEWGYAVLDEGHKIRNPNTSITIYCKELRTSNRIILSGTPMQNNLTELWSLFDFVFPMRLGTLVTFRQQFEFPIKTGGYANASNLQVETAMKCAEALKDTISPYLLQRFKVDVAQDLPKKSERVLFCRLTRVQRQAYVQFLNSDEMNAIMNGRRQALYGVDILRKICNHPDLAEHKVLSKKKSYNYGDPKTSGKMQVVKGLLEMWKANGHKTLLFAQHRIMLDILEKFISRMNGFNYRRMDGNTSIKDRQSLVDEFNKDPDLHVFLLTTKVGGLGVNLTGADRVIIYDPDWNPSTDMQARERAWRLGQKREVEIYRLMTAGTIEEKIYHRQIFKQFLTNKILRDPKQRQTFQLRDLHDLFSPPDEEGQATETGKIFKGSEVKFKEQAEDKTTQITGIPTPPKESDPVLNRALTTVESIAGVSRQEAFAPDADTEPAPSASSGPAEASTANDAAEQKYNQSDRILSALFSRSGVQSALEHDAIIAANSGRPAKVQADPEIIAREARRVAAEAARELKRAGELARTIPAGVPTWTGQVGQSGRPSSPPPPPIRSGAGGIGRRGGHAGMRGRGGGAAGPSSASVLANLAHRQGTSTSSSAAAYPSPTSTTSGPTSRGGSLVPGTAGTTAPRGKDFMRLIRDFILAQGGATYTQMLIDHFNRYCGDERRTAEFKEMLKRIAVLEKGRSGGRGRWVLREEFR